MITEVTIENFKAIHKMESLALLPFSVFIGNNGSGKSSALDGLRLLHNAVMTDLNTSFIEWGGIDKVRNYNSKLSENITTANGFLKDNSAIEIRLKCIVGQKLFDYCIKFNTNITGEYFVVEQEELVCDGEQLLYANATGNNKDSIGYYYIFSADWNKIIRSSNTFPINRLLLCVTEFGADTIHPDMQIFKDYIKSWQFLYLNAHEMGKPILLDRLNTEKKLDYEARNIAEYLLWMNDQGKEYLDNLIRKLTFVLPYLKDLQPNIHDTVNREVELLLHETNENNKRPIPGWLLSSGTLRIVALLAMFETPKKPSVLFIDEVENGLDPRTIGLLINQIQEAYAEKSMQVIVTTHSPYFLDLVPLESIIVSEKDNEKTYFHIPKDEEALTKWKEKFSPGKLYTMGKLTK